MNLVATVHDIGFRRMIRNLNLAMWSMTEKHSKPILYQRSMIMKSHINHAIANVSSYTNICSSHAMHSYMGVTIHFIDGNFVFVVTYFM